MAVSLNASVVKLETSSYRSFSTNKSFNDTILLFELLVICLKIDKIIVGKLEPIRPLLS